MIPTDEQKIVDVLDDKSSWKHDIEELDYYYDDSTGYEIYVDEESVDEVDSDA
jgi:hypothetical protein